MHDRTRYVDEVFGLGFSERRCPAVGSPWFIRLGTILFVITVYKAVPQLAIVLVAGAALLAFGLFVYRGELLPGRLMDCIAPAVRSRWAMC
ncbi:hypothetical protein [Methylobacterium sp. 1030]|uniref:hypothetical protein n=1 Tax=Methylobacterium sp. 1030 TaxID=3156404 RepID=UPI0033989478